MTRFPIARSAICLAISALCLPDIALAGPSCPGVKTNSLFTVSATESAQCDLGAGQSVTVTSTGSIATLGEPAVKVDGVSAGNITNTGTLSVDASNASYGVISIGSSTLGANASSAGTITNAGTITLVTPAGASGIVVHHAAVDAIFNSGSILGADFGILLDTPLPLTVGLIENTGTVTAAREGIYVGATTVGVVRNALGASITGRNGIRMEATTGGRLENSGTITGANGHGVQLNSDDLKLEALVNEGVIQGSSDGVRVEEQASITAGLVNRGQMLGGGSRGDGLALHGYATISGGILNSGTLSGRYGLYADESTINGGIRNTATGLITSTKSAALEILDSIVNDGVVNEGSILGDSYGVEAAYATFNGDVVNTGTIRGVSTSSGLGLSLSSTELNGRLVNAAGASIVGNGYQGIIVSQTTITGGINNAGLIKGSANYSGIRFENSSTLTGGLVNSGQIEGGNGIYLLNSTWSGGLANSGQITGLNANGDGVWLRSGTFDGGDLNNSGTITGGASAAGLRVSNTMSWGATPAKILNSGLIVGGANSIWLDSAVALQVHNSGTLQGDAELGASTLNLEGLAPRVIGATHGGVASQVFVLGRFASEGGFDVGHFDIASGGRFRMAHNVAVSAPVAYGFNNAGTLAIAAGDRPSLTGNYLQGAGATFEIGLQSPSRYGQLAVTGDATLSPGARVHVDVIGAPDLRSTALIPDVLTTTGTLNAGTPTVTDNSLLFNFTASTARDPQALDLLVTTVPDAARQAARTAGAPVAEGVARVIDDWLANGVPAGASEALTALGRMASAGEVTDAMRQLLPLGTGGGAQATNNMLHGLHRIIQARVENNHGLSSGESSAGDRYFWFKPFANQGSQSDRGGVSGFDSRSRGFVVGLDGAVSEASRLGGSLAYVRSTVDSTSTAAPQRTDIDSLALIGYGTYKLDAATDVNYQLDVGHHKNRGWRAIPFMGLAAQSDYASRTLHGGVGAARVFGLGESLNLTPSLRLDYTRVDSRGYTERGAGGLNLSVGKARFEELLLTADAKLVHELSGATKLALNTTLGYDLLNAQAQASSAFAAGGPTFVTRGLNPSPWLIRLGAGLITNPNPASEFMLRYDAEAKPSGYRNHTLSVRWRKLF